VSTYGLTESCGGVVYDGVPFDGVEVRLAFEGAIELRGPTLMDGYRDEPQATAAAFSTDGWLRTGDVGSLDDEVLTVRGRADDAIRSGAETVWPDEVESVLRTHPEVADVAVAGRPDLEWGQRVEAWVVPPTLASPRRSRRSATTAVSSSPASRLRERCTSSTGSLGRSAASSAEARCPEGPRSRNG